MLNEEQRVCPYCGAVNSRDPALMCCSVCEFPDERYEEAIALWKEFWLFMAFLDRGYPLI